MNQHDDVNKWKHWKQMEFTPQKRPVTRSLDVLFDLHLNQQLSKQWRGLWIEAPSRSLWRHCNGLIRWKQNNDVIMILSWIQCHYRTTSKDRICYWLLNRYGLTALQHQVIILTEADSLTIGLFGTKISYSFMKKFFIQRIASLIVLKMAAIYFMKNLAFFTVAFCCLPTELFQLNV